MAVTVYSTKSCPWCIKVKEFLDSLGVNYESVDVGVDRDAAMELVQKTRQRGVPVTRIADRYIVGYNADAIKTALSEEGII